MTLRKHARWMVQLDDRLLELLAEKRPMTTTGIVDTLNETGTGLDYSDMDVSTRCDTLANAGFLSVATRSPQYRITATGQAYLDGQCDAETVTFALPTDGDGSATDLYEDVDRIDDGG